MLRSGMPPSIAFQTLGERGVCACASCCSVVSTITVLDLLMYHANQWSRCRALDLLVSGQIVSHHQLEAISSMRRASTFCKPFSRIFFFRNLFGVSHACPVTTAVAYNEKIHQHGERISREPIREASTSSTTIPRGKLV